MSLKALPDPVPLGVSGMVTIPRDRYIARVGARAAQTAVLLEEEERIEYVARRLSEALNRPLTNPGSEGIAKLVLAHFQGVDLMPHFAEKAIETLRDGKSHNRTAISPDESHVALLFVAWNGTHREVQSERFGNYLKPLLSTARRLVEQGIELGAILEVDAYLRDDPDTNDPGRALGDVFGVDVEYSYIPGTFVGSSKEAAAKLPKAIVLNPDLCDQEERQFLSKLMARSS